MPTVNTIVNPLVASETRIIGIKDGKNTVKWKGFDFVIIMKYN